MGAICVQDQIHSLDFRRLYRIKKVSISRSNKDEVSEAIGIIQQPLIKKSKNFLFSAISTG